MTDFKTVFLEKLEPDIKSGRIKSILDLGCGTSLPFVPLLEKYPNLVYIGIEPSHKSVQVAKKNTGKFKNARIYNSSGYSQVKDMQWGKFDLVVSLSVLEHVKHLEKFLKNSISAAKKGGRIVHRWDLGHALYPSSFKEELQVWLGNNFPSLLPEGKFVRYLGPSTLSRLMVTLGTVVDGFTYHQMLSHKSFLKYFTQKDAETERLVRKIVEWEFMASPHLDAIEESVRTRLFPSIALWARKV